MVTRVAGLPETEAPMKTLQDLRPANFGGADFVGTLAAVGGAIAMLSGAALGWFWLMVGGTAALGVAAVAKLLALRHWRASQ
jgi:hypothetical protein